MSRVIACPRCGSDRWEGAGPCGSCGHKPVKQARRPAAPDAGPRCRRCGDTGVVYSGDEGKRQCPDCTASHAVPGACEKASPGWRCTRGSGHEGPCVAVPADAGARRCTWDHAAWCATYRGGSECDCATWSRREKGGCRCEDCRRWRAENLKASDRDRAIAAEARADRLEAALREKDERIRSVIGILNEAAPDCRAVHKSITALEDALSAAPPSEPLLWVGWGVLRALESALPGGGRVLLARCRYTAAAPDLRGLLREAVEYLAAEADMHAGAEEGYSDFLGRARAALEVRP